MCTCGYSCNLGSQVITFIARKRGVTDDLKSMPQDIRTVYTGNIA